MAIPGVGPVAAFTFRAAVDDPARFARSRTVAAHFGLTPRRYQSGEMDNPGRISKAGDLEVRTALYAAANAIVMRTVAGSGIVSLGLRLMRRKGRRRAVVAVVRNLPSSCIACGPMAPSSAVNRWRASHDLTPKTTTTGSSSPDEVRGRRRIRLLRRKTDRETKQGAPQPIRHMRAAARCLRVPDQTAKRSVTRMKDNDPM
jgi:hypothetical protein